MTDEPYWRDEAMRMNALLHSAMTGGAEAEQRAAKFELERDALLRVVTDNHVALMRAEAAEAKLAKAVEALRGLITCVDDGCYCSEAKMAATMDDANAVLAELEAGE